MGNMRIPPARRRGSPQWGKHVHLTSHMQIFTCLFTSFKCLLFRCLWKYHACQNVQNARSIFRCRDAMWMMFLDLIGLGCRECCLLHASHVSSAVSTSQFLVIRKSMSLLTGPSKFRALQCFNFRFAPALGRGNSKHTFEIV